MQGMLAQHPPWKDAAALRSARAFMAYRNVMTNPSFIYNRILFSGKPFCSPFHVQGALLFQPVF